MSGWGTNGNANRIKDTYVKGFLDISGGSLIVEKTSSLRIMAHDKDEAILEFKPEYFTVNTTASYDVSYSALASLGALGISFEQSTEETFNRIKYITTGDISGVLFTDIGNDDEQPELRVYGLIKGHYGLDVDGDVSFNKQFFVAGDSSMNGNLSVGGHLYVAKSSVFSLDVSMNGNLDVGSGNNSFSVNKDITPGIAFDVSGSTMLRNTLNVLSDVSFGTRLFVVGDSSLNGNLYVNRDLSLNGNLFVTRRSFFTGDVSMNGNVRLGTTNQSVSVNKDVSAGFAFDVSGSTMLRNTLNVLSDVSFGTRFFVVGDSSLNGNLYVNRDLSVNGNLYVVKRSVFTGDVSMNGNVRLGISNQSVSVNKDISDGFAFDVSGSTMLRNTLNVLSDVSFGTRFFVVGDSSLNGNLYVNRDLSVNGNLYVVKRSFFTGDVSMNGNVRLGASIQSVSVNKDISAGFAFDVSGSTMLRNTLNVLSDVSFGTRFFVVGDSSLNGNLYVNRDLSVNGNLYVVKRSVFTGDVSMNGNVRLGASIQSVSVNKDISAGFAFDVSGASKFRGNVDVSGTFTVNGAPISAGGALTGNVQVGSNSGFVTVNKPQFYSDPSLTIYYNFDTSINNGLGIKNMATTSSLYDGSLNFNGSNTILMIDTAVKKFGASSLKNNPDIGNSGVTICNNNIPTFPVSSTMSFSFWVYKPQASSTFDRIFEISDLVNGGVDNNTIALDINLSGVVLPVLTYAGATTPCISTISSPIISYNICNGVWNHIAWVIDASNSYIYINGSIVQRDTINNAFPITTRKSAFVGYCINNQATRDFSGNIDDFRYYNGKALNYAEIYQLYNNNFYTFDICGGFLANGPSVIYEASGSVATANRGTLTLLHGDAGGASSIMFKSVNSTNDYAYVQYEDNNTIPYIQSFYKWNLSPGANNTYGPSTNVDTSVGSNTSQVLFVGSSSSAFFSVVAPSPPSTFPSNAYCISFNQTNETGTEPITNSINYLQSSSITSSANITISFWIRPGISWDTYNPGGGNYYAYTIAHFTNIASSVIDIYIRGYDQKLFVLINGSGANFKYTNSSINNDVWTHVAFTYSTNDGYIYINGIRDEITVGTGYTASGTLTYNNLLLGMKYGENNGTNYRKGFRGHMNFINIFNQTLSDSNITYLYNNPIYGQTTEGGLMTIGIENDSPYNDRITLWPNSGTGYVGINTKTPQATLDINGTLNINGNITNNSGAVRITGESGTLLTLKNTSRVGARSEVNIDFLTQTGNYGMGRISVFDITPNTNGLIGGYTSIMKFYLAGVNAVTEYMSLTELGLIVTGITVGKGGKFGNQDGRLAIGQNALMSGTTGYSNTAIGSNTLTAVAVQNNTAVGTNALQNHASSNCTAVGAAALQTNTTGYSNTAVGSFALYTNTSGINNTAVGVESLRENTNGTNNTAVGSVALRENNTGTNNTAVGSIALRKNTSGTNNTAVGALALFENTSGTDNTAVGINTLYNNTTGIRNTAVGTGALYYLNGSIISNTAVGHNAGTGGGGAGNYNTFIGADTYQSGNGINNTYLGYGAYSSGTYNNSTAIGISAEITNHNQIKLGRNTETVFCADNLMLQAPADNHCYIRNTTANNLYFGTETYNYMWINSSGLTVNKASGTLLTLKNTNAVYNSSQVNIDFASGTSNFFLGQISTVDLAPSSTYRSKMSFKVNYDKTISSTLLEGMVITGKSSTASDCVNVNIYGNVEAVSYNAISDYRMKENMVPLNASFTVDSLNPITYNLKSSGKQDIGFIAHEVQEVYPFLVSGEKDGKDTQSLNYNGFIGILTKEIQVLKKKVSDQDARIADQEAKALEQSAKALDQSAKALEQSAKALEQSAKALDQETRIQALEKMVFDLINK